MSPTAAGGSAGGNLEALGDPSYVPVPNETVSTDFSALLLGIHKSCRSPTLPLTAPSVPAL